MTFIFVSIFVSIFLNRYSSSSNCFSFLSSEVLGQVVYDGNTTNAALNNDTAVCRIYSRNSIFPLRLY